MSKLQIQKALDELLKLKEKFQPKQTIKMEKVTNSIPTSDQEVEFQTCSEKEINLRCEEEEMDSRGEFVDKNERKQRKLKEKKVEKQQRKQQQHQQQYIEQPRIVPPFNLERSLHEEKFGEIQSNINNLAKCIVRARNTIDETRRAKSMKYYEGREMKVHKEINFIRETIAKGIEKQFEVIEVVKDQLISTIQGQIITLTNMCNTLDAFGDKDQVGTLINLTKRTQRMEQHFQDEQ